MNEKDELSDFTSDLNRIIDSVRENVSRSKDYYKFLIGLSTGALVFSVTLIKNFSPSPTCRPLILIGWLCLIISVITGVWLLRKQDEVESQIKSIKAMGSDPTQLFFGIEQDLDKFVTRALLSGYLKKESARDPKNEERIKELKKDFVMPNGKVGKAFLSEMVSVIEKINPAWAPVMHDIVKEAKSWGDLLRKQSKLLYVPNMAKKLRKNYVRISIFEKAMMGSFFAGIILITMFSAINFFSIDVISVIRNLF